MQWYYRSGDQINCNADNLVDTLMLSGLHFICVMSKNKYKSMGNEIRYKINQPDFTAPSFQNFKASLTDLLLYF